ncbi:MAG: hypothetical protein Q8P80_00905, partial [Candidatus Levybacteria bacterium]|nr:hypothetical protein [Candidatus Levybacteria bacterium]
MKKLVFLLILSVAFAASYFIIVSQKQSQYRPLDLVTPLLEKKMSVFKITPHLSINDIFLDDHRWLATLSADKKVTMIATGDVIPARAVNYQSV